MGFNLMEVFVKVGADTSDLESGLGKAGSAVSSFASGVGNIAKVGVGAIAGVGAAIAGTSTAFVNAAGGIAEYGDNIDKMSQKMGISAKGYQEWEAVMQHSGTSMETMKASMKTLANAVENSKDKKIVSDAILYFVKLDSENDLYLPIISHLQKLGEE